MSCHSFENAEVYLLGCQSTMQPVTGLFNLS